MADRLNELRQRAKDIRLEMQKLHTKAAAQRMIALKHTSQAYEWEEERKALYPEYEELLMEIIKLEQVDG